MSESSGSTLHALASCEAGPTGSFDDNVTRAASGGSSASTATDLIGDVLFSDGDGDDEEQAILAGEHSAFETVDRIAPPRALSMLSYLSMNSKEFVRDVLIAFSLTVLFAAGVMRTSAPSLFYAAVSVQALYSRDRADLKHLFPRMLVVLTSAIAIGMILFHVVVNEALTYSSPLLLQVPFTSSGLSSSWVWALNRFSGGRLLQSFEYASKPRVRVVCTGCPGSAGVALPVYRALVGFCYFDGA